MTISELTKILIDFIDDGYGNAPIYFGDKEIKSVVTEDVLPPCDGTFEPYQNIKLSDVDEDEEPNADWEADNAITVISDAMERLKDEDKERFLRRIRESVAITLLNCSAK